MDYLYLPKYKIVGTTWYSYEIYKGGTIYLSSLINKETKKQAVSFLKQLYPNSTLKIKKLEVYKPFTNFKKFRNWYNLPDNLYSRTLYTLQKVNRRDPTTREIDKVLDKLPNDSTRLKDIEKIVRSNPDITNDGWEIYEI